MPIGVPTPRRFTTERPTKEAEILTEETAAQYVRDYFARCNRVAHINRVRPSPDGCDALDPFSAFDVFFRLVGDDYGETVFTIWIEHREDGTPFLYGEW